MPFSTMALPSSVTVLPGRKIARHWNQGVSPPALMLEPVPTAAVPAVTQVWTALPSAPGQRAAPS